MVTYKGWTFTLLGFKRWRVTTPNKAFTFDIIFRNGIRELVERVNLWMEVIEYREYYGITEGA